MRLHSSVPEQVEGQVFNIIIIIVITLIIIYVYIQFFLGQGTEPVLRDARCESVSDSSARTEWRSLGPTQGERK